MKFLAMLGILLCLISLPARGEDAAADARVDLLDAPGGNPIAVLLPGGNPLPTGEARDGYIQVALVGWVRSPGRVPRPGAAPEVPPAPRGIPQSAIPSLSGTVAASLPTGELRYGSGARVAVLGPKEELDGAWNELKKGYEKEMAAAEGKVQEARNQEKNALSSSDNLTQASQNLEKTRKALRQAERERQEVRDRFASRAEDLLRTHQVAETLADSAGHYAFSGIPPGAYRLFAVFTLGEAERRWFLPVEATAAGGVRVDLKGDETGPDPYFGAR
jgi:hypothetical protein